MTEPHESSAQLAMLPAEEIAQQLAKGSLTSVELVDNCLERIASIDARSTTIALDAGGLDPHHRSGPLDSRSTGSRGRRPETLLLTGCLRVRDAKYEATSARYVW